MKPLVSILIPAYNAGGTIVNAIQSALAQTWPRKEIIVVNDGSTDSTEKIARSFARRVTVLSTENHGLSAAVNNAFRLCNGDYIQELDADDLMLPDKIERQLAALREGESKRILLSSPWAPFYYRTHHARFVNNSLCEDLSPVEWLLRKMNENLHMQNATWLVSRELAEAAGPWDTRLHYDQDGEYFARVLLASEGTRFVSGTGIFYRVSGMRSINYLGNSRSKRESLLRSLMLHVQYLLSLENSERTRKACLTYLQNWYFAFCPGHPKAAAELSSLAAKLQGHLETPSLRWKYAWLSPLLGRKSAAWAEIALPHVKATCIRHWDKIIYRWERRNAAKAETSYLH